MTTLKGNLKTFLFKFYFKESQAIQSQLFCATHRVKSPLRYPMLVLEAFSATVFDSNLYYNCTSELRILASRQKSMQFW